MKRKTIGLTLVLMTSGLGARTLDPVASSVVSARRGPAGFDETDWAGRRAEIRDSARRQRADLRAQADMVDEALAVADALFIAESEDIETFQRIAEMTAALEAIAAETQQRRDEYDLLLRDFTKLAEMAKDVCAHSPQSCDPGAEDLGPDVCTPGHPAGLTCQTYVELDQIKTDLTTRERRYREAIARLNQRSSRPTVHRRSTK